MNQHFTHLLRVRYSECDAQKVVYNAKYAEYADIAATEYTRAIWGDYTELLKRGIDNQVVDFHISWQAPARFDDVLAIQVHTQRIGNTSYALQCDFLKHSTGDAIAQAEITYVMVSPEKHEKMSIPAGLRASLEKGAPGIVANHAGVDAVVTPPRN